MNKLPTPEEICQLDTFTLEEKIQEIQNHPQRSLYDHLLRIAKLELIDRLQIEDFGTKLANDQYLIDAGICMLPQQTKKEPIKSLHNQKDKKTFLSKMQMNSIPGGCYVTIGKPPVDYHYKPKLKRVQTVQKGPKKYLKAKRGQYSRPAQKKMNLKQAIGKKVLIETKHILKGEEKELISQNKQILETIVINAASKEEFSLKEKLKRQVRGMQDCFRENDAYDDMRLIKLTPQNLKEQQTKIINQSSDEIPTQIEEEEKENASKIDFTAPQQSCSTILNIPSIDQKEQLKIIKVGQQIQEQIKEQKIIENIEKQNSFMGIKSQIFREQVLDNCKNTNSYEEQTEKINPSLNMATTNVSNEQEQNNIKTVINLDNLNLNARNHINKQSKCQSMRSLKTKPIQNIKSNYQPFISKLQDRKYNSNAHQREINTKIQDRQQNKGKADAMKSANTCYGSLRPVKTTLDVFPYHEMIGSFQKLFPHSKNLLLTLRSVQQNIRLHFEKQIDQKSRYNDFLRLNQSQMMFKIISDCEKARKYSNLFNIEVQSYHKRGSTMMQRLKRQMQNVPNCNMLFYRVIRTKEEVYDIVNSSFQRTNNWFQLPHGMQLKMSWNLLWTWSRPQIDFQNLFYFQKVNHFLGNKQIARKDLLKKNIQKIQKLGAKMKQYFDIIPETFLLPGENMQFIRKFRQCGLKDKLNYWILKPVGLSRGRGISLINKLQDVIFSEPVVLQKYVMNPLLVDGFKFDMRIYVLVTSINPLEAFLYRQGFARMSTERYSISEELIGNKFIHLTNFSIQRQNVNQNSTTLEEKLGGCKISLKMLAQRLIGMGIQWKIIQKQIQNIILKSLVACMNVIPQNPNCFELFGYDIFIDSNLRCWLLQVNSSPSLEKEFILDEVIKQQMVDDIVQVVHPISYDRERLLQVVERRRRQAQGLKSSISTSINSPQQLDQDLHYILHGQTLRKYGQAPKHNNFHMLSPSEKYHQIIQALQQYKIDPIVKPQY